MSFVGDCLMLSLIELDEVDRVSDLAPTRDFWRLGRRRDDRFLTVELVLALGRSERLRDERAPSSLVAARRLEEPVSDVRRVLDLARRPELILREDARRASELRRLPDLVRRPELVLLEDEVFFVVPLLEDRVVDADRLDFFFGATWDSRCALVRASAAEETRLTAVLDPSLRSLADTFFRLDVERPELREDARFEEPARLREDARFDELAPLPEDARDVLEERDFRFDEEDFARCFV